MTTSEIETSRSEHEGNEMSKFKQIVIQQRMTALAKPCEHAEQCANPRYFFAVYPAQGVRCGVVLTVNVGEE